MLAQFNMTEKSRSDRLAEQEFRELLRQRPRKACVAISARASLRALPLIFHETARNRAEPRYVLFCVRAILVSAVWSRKASTELAAAARLAFERAENISSSTLVDPREAYFAAARSARCVFDDEFQGTASGVADGADHALFARSYPFSLRDLKTGPEVVFEQPLWERAEEPSWLVEALIPHKNLLETEAEWHFWSEWYRGFLIGKPLDWGLQREIALIPDVEWAKGPARIAELIKVIRAKYPSRPSREPGSTAEKPISKSQTAAMANRLMANRDPLALSIASGLVQIAEFRERVRGTNELDPQLREEFLEFLDSLSNRLTALLSILPGPDQIASDDQGEDAVFWLEEYKRVVATKFRKYTEPGNVAEATLPTGIILTCTCVGTLLGQPLVGAAVGGLITGHINPGKAASQLIGPPKNNGE